MNIYKNMSREEIERQYFLRGLRPDYEVTDIPTWLARSRAYVESSGATVDVEYGPRERNKLDFFASTGEHRGFVLYIHGGYWQRGDKSVYSLLAQPLVKRGISVAMMNYQMCPDVRMSEIAPQARLAVAWLWRNAKELGFSRDNFNVMGHSAGGHLSAEMMFTDFGAESADLPAELIHAGIALSGIYDFEPILYCSENQGLRMDDGEARAVSTIYRSPATDAPMLIGYGEQEPPDMRRQSQDFFEKFHTSSTRMECLSIPEADHFDVVNVLADENSELFSRVMSYLVE